MDALIMREKKTPFINMVNLLHTIKFNNYIVKLPILMDLYTKATTYCMYGTQLLSIYFPIKHLKTAFVLPWNLQ